MLTPWWEWPNRGQGLALSYFGTVAADPRDIKGTYMQRSGGRRKAGRPARYFVYRDGAFIATITAYTDEEAIAKANARLTTKEIDA